MMNYKNGSINWFWLFDGLIKQAYPISVASPSNGVLAYSRSQQYISLIKAQLWCKNEFKNF